MPKVKVALCQMKVTASKEENLAKAHVMIENAAEQGAEIVVLPEMFNCPYDIHSFGDYAEEVPEGQTVKMLSRIAGHKGIYLIGGSIPELANGYLYNTCLIFNPEGKIVGRHRKVHLFDVQVKGGIQFMESKVLKGGDSITLVDTPWGKIGVMICYDIRFPELTRKMAKEGARLVFVPAAFNMTTGPLHWQTLFKSRALDNEIFVLGNSPARNPEASYIAYGYSLAVSPWGRIIAEMDEKEGTLIVDLNLDEIDEVREALPVWQQRREELY